MLRYVFLACLIISGTTLTGFAQRGGDQSIEDSIIGWWTNNRFDHLKPQTDPNAKKKEAIVNDMVKWMKTSYTPVGGLGTSSRYIGPKGYGVNFLVWNVSHDKRWTEPNGKFKPIPEENTRFDITANQLYGAFPIYFINTGNEFYFTIQPDGYASGSQSLDKRKGTDPRIHPNVHPFVTWMNEWCTVYLTPNNKLPWTPVSRGELLQKAEEGLKKVLEDKKKEVATSWPDKKQVQEEVLQDFTNNEIATYRANISTLKTRYQSSLNEPAVIRDMQPTIYSFNTDPDIFKIDRFGTGPVHAFQVFKLDAATVAKLGDVTPQWVAAAFPFEKKEDGNQLFEMFTALSQNINYQYIYDYFYAPEKVKGRPYVAADAEGLKARLDNFRSRTTGIQGTIAKKQTGLSGNVVLFDDFSQEQEGGKPAGWYFRSVGKPHVISKINGESGNWLKLGYANDLTSTTLKTLPENFSLEYDLATSAFEGNWGASLTMELSGKKKGGDGVQYSSYFKTAITAGNQSALEAGHNYRGEVRIEFQNRPSKMDYNDIGGFFDAPQPFLTNTKRKVHVQLIKKGEGLTVLLDGKEFAKTSEFKTRYGKPCGDCSIPAGVVYDKMVIRSLTQDGDNVGCYIGNIKVTAL